MTSLRAQIRDAVESAMDSAIPEPWEVSSHAANRIIEAIKSALLSEEAVMAGARGLWQNYYDRQNTGWDQEDQDAHWADEDERNVFLTEAYAALTAAIATLEKADD